MPSIENNTHTLLQGLSDFWIRFYKDSDELEAMYRGTEVLIAQAYLDMLSAFLNISVTETPLFNQELFKLITIRENSVRYVVGANPSLDRYALALPDNMVSAHVLQNKVIDPTATLEQDAGYEIDSDALEFRFVNDPSGQAGNVITTLTNGNLLTYGIAANLKRFYVTEGTPFINAKPGHWLRIQNSGAGNDHTYRIARVLDTQTVLVQEGASTTLTTPDPNTGSLLGTLINSEFAPAVGYGHRVLSTAIGGSFDDETQRNLYEMSSWFADSPVGLGVRKGDVLRVLDRDAVALVPTDFDIVLVRHNKLYVSTDTPVTANATGVTKYVVLRESADPNILGETDAFVQTTTGTPKTATNGSLIAGDVLSVATTPFATSDRQRFVTLSGCGDITWTASISRDGVLTRTGGMSSPLARAFAQGKVTISGSTQGNNGTYTINTLTNVNDCVILGGLFTAETGLSVLLEGITNDGTYRVRKTLTTSQLEITPAISYPDPNNGAVQWRVHDGYQLPLAHSRLVRDSVALFGVLGNEYVGGSRRPIENTDYQVNYETGTLLQIGYHAGTWGVLVDVYMNYSWLTEVFAEVTAGAGTLSLDDSTVVVNETAMWAPDVLVDRFNLYNNYGYLINRFEASSETYREFIRGVFQLYILGPTLERIESALNVIAGFPVVRDDGEVLQTYDATSDVDYNIVTTLRLNGDTATYQYPKLLLLRSDIQNPANYGVLSFESFEPLTLAFKVSDYVEDPAWWTDIIVPTELMPNESLHRRRTLTALIENVVGAWDGPRIGDPGFFVGADDEGIIPSFIATYPAKRRKMANVVMNTFLKWNVFFVRFDDTVTEVLSPAFISDLIDLILVAKPGYRMMFIEPLNSFEDTMLLLEDDLEITANLPFPETVMTGAQGLTVQSFSWNIGDSWRFAPVVSGQSLVTADGTSIPNSGAAISLGAQNLITKHLGGPDYVQEDIDYDIDYVAGTLTPKTIWPAGAYTIDFHNIVLTVAGSEDPSLGDTPYVIGGLDPSKVRGRQELFWNGTVYGTTPPYRLYDVEASFVSALHTGQYVSIRSGNVAGLHQILRVIDANTVVLRPDRLYPVLGASDVTGLSWGFASEEPDNGRIYYTGGAAYFESATALFRTGSVGRYLRIKDATNPSNNKRHRILQVISMGQVILAGTPVAETDLHWRMEGSEAIMDLIERPLQITVT